MHDIHAGEELCSSTKTYVNTLIVLYSGFGFDVEPAVSRLERIFSDNLHESQDIASRIFKFMNSNAVKGR